MTDLTNILGGPWKPPVPEAAAPPEQQFLEAIANAGLTVPEDILIDGQIHRFRTGTGKRKLDRSGWYVAHNDGVPCIAFGDWREGIERTFTARTGEQYSPAQQMEMAARMKRAKELRDAEKKKSQENTANVVEQIWSSATNAEASHPYLARKGVEPNGAKVTGDGRLIVPLFNADGEISSVQYISGDGTKLYHKGGKTQGCYWVLGALDGAAKLYIAEGFATAATIHQASGQPCAVAYSASNLPPVCAALSERGLPLVVVADNDSGGIGRKYADQCAAQYRASVIMPPVEGDANDYAQAGNDLMTLLEPPDDGWLVPADEFCQEPAPIKWLVKRWLQQNALIMVHGPSGGGKTFTVLDWCLRIASGVSDWQGQKVNAGNVVYLAGEGHHGLRGRVAAWKQENSAGNLNMWLSKAGCDLNKPDGYLRVVEHVRALNKPPAMIVVDTLHRFLDGDENSAQDAKTMLDACGGLMAEFGCSVLLVHHTGVSDEAQHRARGSSAWRGALDIEISVLPPKTGAGAIELLQRKSKDAEAAEPLFCELKSVAINGWVDEDGEPVTSAVAVPATKPESAKVDGDLATHKKRIGMAWNHAGMELAQGMPYLSAAALEHWLSNRGGIKPRQLAGQMDGAGKGIVGSLITAEVIQPYDHGFVIIDKAMASSLLISRSEPNYNGSN